MNERTLIEQVLLTPETVLGLTELQWDLLLRQGRSSNLLGRLARLLDERSLLDAVMPAARVHLLSADRINDRQGIAVRWEVSCIRKALAGTGVPIILLKGAAYLIAGLPAARGRMFSDVDILVPKHAMANVESALMLHGWRSTDSTQYDQRYYRSWMHEIPPMQHIRRGTTIDVHHAILPITARIKVNTAALFDAAIPLKDERDIFVLQPTDMVLHSATHLFHEGEMENGLRDLFDLDSLMRHFGTEPGFWDMLVPRAVHLGLTRPLYYAIKFAVAILGTPVPAHVIEASQIGRPSAVADRLMELCYLRVLRPNHSSTNIHGSAQARVAVYIRAHWIRMPVHLLAYHLGRKLIVRPKIVDEESGRPAQDN